jgi:hypothetical protein
LLYGPDVPPRERRRPPILQLISWAVVLVLGALVFATKVLAQPAPGKGAAGGQPAAVTPAAKAPAALPAKVPPVAPATASAAPPAEEPKDAKEAAKEPSPLDDTVIQTDADFPPDLSDEEKAAIGTGKVPIHREGKFRSPFASPKRGKVAHAKVGLVISEIREYDIQKGAFEADFFLSLTGDTDLPPVSPVFTNGHDVECKTTIDVPTFKFYRCSGSFTSEVDLRKYPFDTQYLTIEMEDEIYGVDALVFEPDKNRTSLDSSFRIAGYGVGSVGATAFKHKYPPRFDRDDLYVSRYKFSLGIDRFATSAAFSVFVPACIIVLISLIGLWVPPEELEVRSNAGAPMLAAAVLFHYSLIQALPATGYLTRADKLMLAVYVSLFLNMASTWVFLLLDEENVHKAFRLFRAWIPPITVAIMAAGSAL